MRGPGAGRLEVADSVGGGARGPGVGSFGTSIAVASAGVQVVLERAVFMSTV